MGLLRSKPFVLLLIVFALLFSVVQGSATQAQEGPRQHVVKTGENLYRIALQYGLSVDQVAQANGITDYSRVYVGQVLVIPAQNAAATTAVVTMPTPTAVITTETTNVTTAAASTSTYVVARGDTIKTIAAKFNVTWQSIVSANNLTNPNLIYPGQQLVIPGADSAVQPVVQPVSQAPAEVPANPPAVASTAGSRTHTVAAGQGLAQIAALYGVSWISIARQNNLSNPNLIYAGMVLVIPESDAAAGVTAPAVSTPPNAPNTDGKVILVILSEQRVYAYENGVLQRNVVVSTGTAATPTVIGEYQIYIKYRAQLMTGPGYYLPNVPYVMYFYQGYGLHGTYWHSNFGQPMSHGCVNLPTPEAAWFYDWAPLGTRVVVRYFA